MNCKTTFEIIFDEKLQPSSHRKIFMCIQWDPENFGLEGRHLFGIL